MREPVSGSLGPVNYRENRIHNLNSVSKIPKNQDADVSRGIRVHVSPQFSRQYIHSPPHEHSLKKKP